MIGVKWLAGDARLGRGKWTINSKTGMGNNIQWTVSVEEVNLRLKSNEVYNIDSAKLSDCQEKSEQNRTSKPWLRRR